ncbi:F510_1955 family glycosylhydrolase [Carbonactinospora thermoautotrophica]|uniref:F510_1955 family glycosylhydrolase n=1 Tax=Carbonactinospora thermoautotrophica TaxID=1469144 RepID=UPI0008358C1F|nr:hypothetical protein [Carbonactinospora thermoautotrophica]
MTHTPRRAFRATALLATALVALAACVGGSSGRAGDHGDDHGTGVSHVHGLGVNPGDGKVYVATHDGVYRIEAPGKATRVGTSRQDTMGFTVIGKNTFLGSGHPAPDEGGPAHLGLIESTDAGVTWQRHSLAGEADFHVLEYAHGTVYGYDSTSATLRVSTDKKTWDDRARLAAADIEVHPTDPNTVLATTEQGVVRSTDGGRTFRPTSGGTLQMLLAWPTTVSLYAVDPAGTLSVSVDGGNTWKAISTIPGGRPQAFEAVDQRRLLAVTGEGIYESRDGGATFTQLLPLSQ